MNAANIRKLLNLRKTEDAIREMGKVVESMDNEKIHEDFLLIYNKVFLENGNGNGNGNEIENLLLFDCVEILCKIENYTIKENKIKQNESKNNNGYLQKEKDEIRFENF